MRSISKFSTVSCKLWRLALGLVITGMTAHAMAQSIVMSSTTSTEQSGLFGFLLPEFKKAIGIDTKVVALGTGQALDMARRGDADVVFVHDQPAEEKFVAEGFGIKRFPVMYNDFVVVGPQAPAMRLSFLEAIRVARMLQKFAFGIKRLCLHKKAVATKNAAVAWAPR
ncbi:MAG: hypothetical protein RL770_1600 [Pseudomonadota bacterium]